MDALTFWKTEKPAKLQPIYVLAGDEHFLKRLALDRLMRLAFGDRPEDANPSDYDGPAAVWADVHDELDTLPFLGGRRVVVVRDADTFVSKHRETLEKYVKNPNTAATLVLEVKSWKSNTRLAKAIPATMTIKCESPKPHALPAWCSQWAESKYGKKLATNSASLLVELAGTEMGVLDQELAKLSTYVGDAPQIQSKEIDTLVGHGRTETAWRMLDAISEGKRAVAMNTLHKLLDQGEEPIAILGAMSWQLRRLAQAARLGEQGVPIRAALGRLGVPPFAQQRTERHVRSLGPRALKLYDWLLEADLGAKSSGGLNRRTVLERLIVKLS